jgi:tetratricopeptide (TPR) repeat protein
MQVSISVQQETEQMRAERLRTDKIAALLERGSDYLAEQGVVVTEVAKLNIENNSLYIDDKLKVGSWYRLDRDIPNGSHVIKRYTTVGGEELFYEIQFTDEVINSGHAATQFLNSYGDGVYSREYVGFLLTSPTMAIASLKDDVQVEITPNHGKDFYSLYYLDSATNFRSLIIDPDVFEPTIQDELRLAQKLDAQQQTPVSLDKYITALKAQADNLSEIAPKTRLAGHFYLLTQLMSPSELFLTLQSNFSQQQYQQILQIYLEIFNTTYRIKRTDNTFLVELLTELSSVDLEHKHIYAAIQAYVLSNQGSVEEAFALIEPYLDSQKFVFDNSTIEKLSNVAYNLAEKHTAAHSEQSLVIYKLCTAQVPTKSVYAYMTGYVLVNLEHYQEAVSYLEKALGIESKDINYLLTYANTLVELKRYHDAEAAYQRIMETMPKYAYMSYCNLAEMYHGRGMQTEAWEWIQKAYAEKPELDVIKELYQQIEAEVEKST